MAAGHDRRQVRVAASAARKDVADLVDPDGAAGLLAPANEQPARLAVEVAGRETAYTALGVAPICASSIRLAHSRSPFTRRLRLPLPAGFSVLMQ